MAQQRPIYELAILGRITWNLHSLNNEGSIGNVVEPRTLKLADGTTTDGVSGEMLKHIHALNTWALEADKSRFCPSCHTLEPMRADRNPQVTGARDVNEALDQALTDCAICDLHGFLVQKPTIHRQSTVEFGWAVGLKDSVYRDIHQHARHAVGERGRGGRQPTEPPVEGEEAPEQEAVAPPTAQMLYSRPTRSGIYGVVSLFAPWRIGLNTITYRPVNGVDRQRRFRLALQAYQVMFSRTDGAMTSTRLPHLEAFEGVLVISRTNFPVPVISPLKEGYREEIEALAQARGNAFECFRFDNLVEFVKKLQELENDQPYALTMPSS